MSFTTSVTGVFRNIDNSDSEVLVTADVLPAQPMRVLAQPMDSWVGRRLFVAGHSDNDPLAGGYMTIRSFWTTEPRVQIGGDAPSPADNVTICVGDSGGPEIAWLSGAPYVTGVNSGGGGACYQAPPLPQASGGRGDVFSTWLRGLVPTRGTHVHSSGGTGNTSVSSGDMNGDNRVDYVVTTSISTMLYRSTGTGFTIVPLTPGASNTWLRIADMVMGRIETALGNYNGDGYDDLAILTVRGLDIYLSNGTTFPVNAAPFYRSTDRWQIGYANLHAAHFGDNENHPLADQLLIQDYSRMWLYDFSYGTPPLFSQIGGVENSIGHAVPVVGDFTGDGYADLLLRTETGGRLSVGGTFCGELYCLPVLTTTTCSDTGWGIGEAHFAPGNFLPAAGVELIKQDTGGYSINKYDGVCFTTVFGSTTWKANDTNLVVGKFNNDAYDDVIVQSQTGSVLDLATGVEASPWTYNVWVRNDLTLLNTSYVSGDWSGDGLGDLWITTNLGSYGYRGRAAGGFDAGVWYYSSLKLQTFMMR